MQLKYQNNWFYVLLQYLVIPAFVSFIVHYFLCEKTLKDLYDKGGTDLITVFSLINGFLLAAITIMLATTNFSESKIKEHCITADLPNKRSVFSILKRILLHDVLFQFLLILCICFVVLIQKISDYSHFLSWIGIYLVTLSISQLILLIKKFIVFEGLVDFHDA